jgi:hypothetical protein
MLLLTEAIFIVLFGCNLLPLRIGVTAAVSAAAAAAVLETSTVAAVAAAQEAAAPILKPTAVVSTKSSKT